MFNKMYEKKIEKLEQSIEDYKLRLAESSDRERARNVVSIKLYCEYQDKIMHLIKENQALKEEIEELKPESILVHELRELTQELKNKG